MQPIRILTGITTSGTAHLGNYVGAIRPAIAASRAQAVESCFFLADYHALIKVADPARIQRSTLEIAATWLACGLEPAKVWFYRQSDIPETTELTWLLTCVAGKGALNRAHAYKAAVDRNRAGQEDDDAGVTAGLFMYPVLMAADILLFNANRVPVGRDQIQHIEMARDFAQRFNHLYGEHFTLPEAVVDEQVATLPGLDGRKMSKSYDNTIPLFAPRETLKKLIGGIVTDSRGRGEAKDADSSHVFQIYRAFASDEETAAMREAFGQGIGWGDAKLALLDRIDSELAPLRQRYEALIVRPAEIEAILQDGARRVRAQIATPTIATLRHAVGLRGLDDNSATTSTSAPSVSPPGEIHAKAMLPTFKQYRERDGKFYFKLSIGDRLLLQSLGFESPRDAGSCITALKRDGYQENANSCTRGDGVAIAEVTQALAAVVAAEGEPSTSP